MTNKKKFMTQLIFLSNELLNPKLQKQLHLPLEFVSFGIVKNARMYSHYKETKRTFITINDNLKKWGNTVVYGAIFTCTDFNFYARLLDSYHLCSFSVLYKNHICDLHHRTQVPVNILYFNTLDDLNMLKYKESQETFNMQIYIGNINHPKISQRINSVKTSYRIISGIDAINFKELFWEVNKN